jgi:DnaJ-domain-containing protein 1
VIQYLWLWNNEMEKVQSDWSLIDWERVKFRQCAGLNFASGYFFFSYLLFRTVSMVSVSLLLALSLITICCFICGSDLVIDSDVIEKDLYKRLGLRKNASLNDIKKAFRKLARKYHPDKLSALNDTLTTDSSVFHEVALAYEILSSKAAREEYDRQREVWEYEMNRSKILSDAYSSRKFDAIRHSVNEVYNDNDAFTGVYEDTAAVDYDSPFVYETYQPTIVGPRLGAEQVEC